jgi:hypothetical protein
MAFFSGSTTTISSSIVYYDSVNQWVGVGLTPSYNLHSSGTVAFPHLTDATQSFVATYNTSSGQLFYTASKDILVLQQALTTNVTVGALSSGTSFASGVTLESILRSMLITYIAPTIGAPSLKNGASTVLSSNVVNQVGTSITYNTASFTATADNPNGRFAYSASFTASNTTGGNDFNYYFGNNVLGTTNDLWLGASRTATRTTSAGTVTFTIRGINPQTNAVITAATRTITYVYPIFYGMSATGNLSADAGLTTLVEQQGTKVLSINGLAKYIYFAYPATYPDLTSIKDGSGYETITSFNKYTRNQDGAGTLWTGISYKIYINFWNPANSTLSVTNVNPAQNYTFTF